MTPEKQIENKIRQNFINAGGYINKVFASPNTNKGIPDLIGVLNGVFVALEVKKPVGGKPTPVQIKNLQAIANAGGLAFVTNDPNLINALKRHTKKHAYQNPKLTTTICHIDYLHTIKQPSVNDAKSAWQQTKEPHSLQII